VLVRPDTQLLETLRAYGTLDAIGEDDIFATVAEVFLAFQADQGTAPVATPGPAGPDAEGRPTTSDDAG
jgi:hypothetical protein